MTSFHRRAFIVPLMFGAVGAFQKFSFPAFSTILANNAETLAASSNTRLYSGLNPPSNMDWNRRPQEIIAFKVTTVFDTEELQARERDQPMFVPSVRRDIYKILRNPRLPGEGMSDSDTMFDTVLLAKSSDGSSSWDSFAFAARGANPQGFVVLDDEQMLDAISSIGKITPVALAVTQAFEAYLSHLVQTWGEREAAALSVEFLVAFGNEMTKRLDVNNRIRSTGLSPQEIQILSTQPFCNFVDSEALETFQGQDDSWRDADMVPLASNYGMSDLGERNYGTPNQPSDNYDRPNNTPPPYGNSGVPDQQGRMDPNNGLQSNSRLRSYDRNSGPNQYRNGGNMGRQGGPPSGNDNYGGPSNRNGPSYAPQQNNNRNNRPPPDSGYPPSRQGNRRDNALWDDSQDDKGWYENF